MTTISQTLEVPAVVASDDNICDEKQLIGQLQAKARSVLDPLIPVDSSISLLDYPLNPNVGDSMIWLGVIAYLQLRGMKPRYFSDIYNYDPDRIRKTLPDNPVILLNGGGNFGTLWPEQQPFRLKVLRDFPGVPIVQLPQSLYFDDEQALAETAEAIRQHGNFTLIVRDKFSYDLSVRHFDCKVQLCPDMAFFIGPIPSNKQPRYDRFILSRTDHEKSNDWLHDLSRLGQGLSVGQGDWVTEGRTEKFLNSMQYSSSCRSLLEPKNALLFSLCNRIAKVKLNRGKALLEQGRVVIADRLHAHILSLLLNKPHVVIDNNYKKLSGFHQAWTAPYGKVKFATNLEEALDIALDLDLQIRNSGFLGRSRYD